MTIMAQNMGLIETSARLLSKKPPEKEIIHSGHFMVSNFEAEAQDDEDVFASNPEIGLTKRDIASVNNPVLGSKVISNSLNVTNVPGSTTAVQRTKASQHNISIETSLTKLFQCMSLAYRQKLTSPKWNRFKGIRLRWKDKIRLNNVIWRCWHMQFITKKNALVCQFASPLDVDTHNKPEAIVLEGKYWKRKLNAVTTEYKKWRLFYRNRLLGWSTKDGQDDPSDMLSELEMLEWQPHSDDCHMMVDEDYMEFMTDTLFSTISANQPFAFPDTREIARGASLADFIQPSLVQLQPNLDDFMDTLEPLQDLFYSKLPPVPEEAQSSDNFNLYRSLNYSLPDAKPAPPQYYPPYPAPSKQRVVSYPPAPAPAPVYYQQQLSPPPQQQRTSPSPPRGEYYATPRMPSRSNSLPVGSTLPNLLKREDDMFVVPKVKAFSRSRSGSCLSGQVAKPSPLVSAASDPQLSLPPSHSHNTPSALLAQLLTTSGSASQAYGSQGASGYSGEGMKMSGSMPSLETYYKQADRGNDKATHRSVIYSTQSDNGTLNLSASRDARIPQVYESTFTFTGGQKPKQLMSPHMHTAHSSTSRGLLTPQASPSHQPSTSQVISSASSSPKHPDSPSASECLSLSPLNVASPSATPQSPTHPTGGVYKEHRRVSHINAEQKRRCNIKNGFDTLHSLIPQLSQNPNAKLSKAAMLQKGADYIRQLRSERQALKDEIDNLKQQVESLNSAISNCQALLPATGAPVSRQRSTKMREMYDEYVRVRTQENWKFWILSLLCEPLLVSFNSQVSTHSLDELYRTTLNWVDQHCTLSVLRPLVLNALRQLCTTTDILSDPARLPAEALAAAKSDKRTRPS